jgi:hypothetical protein
MSVPLIQSTELWEVQEASGDLRVEQGNVDFSLGHSSVRFP